jgi:hypothetical protein
VWVYHGPKLDWRLLPSVHDDTRSAAAKLSEVIEAELFVLGGCVLPDGQRP